jgi:hypothetical protein
MFDIESERPWLFRKITQIITDSINSLNLTEVIGRVLSEGDNNYSVVTSGIILNMTHYMYNRTDFLPGVPTPSLEINIMQ